MGHKYATAFFKTRNEWKKKKGEMQRLDQCLFVVSRPVVGYEALGRPVNRGLARQYEIRAYQTRQNKREKHPDNDLDTRTDKRKTT